MILAMNAMEIVGLISAIVGLVGAIIALIPTVIRVIRLGKEIIKNKDWNKIKEIANAAMIAAEAKFKEGSDKKEVVIDAVKQACFEANIPLDEDVLDNLVEYIDTIISYHNNMTQANKDLKKQQRLEAKKAKEIK